MKTNLMSVAHCLAVCLFTLTIMPSCKSDPLRNIKHTQQQAAYHPFSIKIGDTISFPLSEHHYNNISSSNYFVSGNLPYISFYDKGSKSLLIYEFNTRKLLKAVPLVKWVKQTKLDKASVYMINFDSIIVATQLNLFLLDSSGLQHRKIDFFEDKDKLGTVNNNEPAVVKGQMLYIGVKPYVNERSLAAHKKWRALYKINLETGKKEMVYPLPEIYHQNLYGYPFMEFGYCINNKGNFVFSFAADQNLYETDMESFEHSYNAQSRYHKGPISPMKRTELESTGTYKIYATKDSYGPVIFDPINKYYLRQAKQGISQQQLTAKDYSKKRSIILLDEQFRIIGELPYDGEFSFTSLIFTPEGKSYVRVNHKDESALHFAMFSYQQSEEELVRTP